MQMNDDKGVRPAFGCDAGLGRTEANRAPKDPRALGDKTSPFERMSESARRIPMNRLLRRKEVEQTVGLSRASIYRLVDTGDFPYPVRVGPRAVRWRSTDIERWISERPPTRPDS